MDHDSRQGRQWEQRRLVRMLSITRRITLANDLEPDTITAGVSAALRALVPADTLTEALRPMTRSLGRLSSLQAVVSEEEQRVLTGFSPPRLPTSMIAGRREMFTVPGRNGEARLERDEAGQPFTSSFAVFYLPGSLLWTAARRSSVLSSDVVALHVGMAGPGADEREWPQQMGQRWTTFDADGSPLPAEAMADFALVQVAGATVGVQVDVSGAVALGWSLRRAARGAERWWNVELHLRREPQDAIRLVHDAGLLI